MREFKECYKVIEVMVVIMVMRVMRVIMVMVVLNFAFCDFIGESAYIEQLETVVNHNRQ